MLVLMRSTKELTYGTNYDETYVSKEFIWQRAITITADVQSKVYGDTDPGLAAQVTELSKEVM
jgi:hypothetical protein